MDTFCPETYANCRYTTFNTSVNEDSLYNLGGAYGSFVDEAKVSHVYMALTVSGEFKDDAPEFAAWAQIESNASPGLLEAFYCESAFGDDEVDNVVTITGSAINLNDATGLPSSWCRNNDGNEDATCARMGDSVWKPYKATSSSDPES